jgi:hypothetical protein
MLLLRRKGVRMEELVGRAGSMWAYLMKTLSDMFAVGDWE